MAADFKILRNGQVWLMQLGRPTFLDIDICRICTGKKYRGQSEVGKGAMRFLQTQ